MDNREKNFLRVQEFFTHEWQAYSAAGKSVHHNWLHFHVPGEEELLRREWRTSGLFRRFISDVKDARSLVKDLEKLPDIRNLSSQGLAAHEMFDLKKFLRHYREIHRAWRLFNPRPFSFHSNYDKLWRLLNKGQDETSFAISDAYSGKLRRIRIDLAAVRNEQASVKDAFHRKLERELGLKTLISGSEFTLDHHSPILASVQECGCVTPIERMPDYLLFRLIYPPKIEELNRNLALLRESERSEERKVLETLNRAVSRDLDHIKRDACMLTEWERCYTKALAGEKWGLAKPTLGRTFTVSRGRLIPLEQELTALSLSYEPLDLKTRRASVIICGPNMGGKTQALKAIGFLQALFQYGWFVPAEKFSSRLYQDIFCSATECFPEKTGLSSFGAEISYLAGALSSGKGDCLFLLDEFSRTTNVKEGLALTRALIEYFAGHVSTLFLTTHYDVLSVAHADRFHTGGLRDRDRLTELYRMEGAEKIAQLHRMMDFRLYPAGRNKPQREAVTIAAVLGLPEDIVKRAGELLSRK
ncbi:MAG: hypothetical protein PHQ23_02490 [Candidatus Wallbacteria bacterium]|nr:hypothetical protein [Candidatus Wallbacteria bacterium]